MADYNVSQYEVSDADMAGHLVSELEDAPALSAAALKAKFDDLTQNVLVPKYNNALEELQTVLDRIAWMKHIEVFHTSKSVTAGATSLTVSWLTLTTSDRLFVMAEQSGSETLKVNVTSAKVTADGTATLLIETTGTGTVTVGLNVLIYKGSV